MYVSDGAGKIMAHVQYDEWGGIQGTWMSLEAWGLEGVQSYTGHPYDEVLNVYFAQARLYNPETKRFMANDPSGYVDIDFLGSDRTETYISLNLYTYSHNNPVMRIDPDGNIDYFSRQGLIFAEIFGKEFWKAFSSNMNLGIFTIPKKVEETSNALLELFTLVRDGEIDPRDLPDIILGSISDSFEGSLDDMLWVIENWEKYLPDVCVTDEEVKELAYKLFHSVYSVIDAGFTFVTPGSSGKKADVILGVRPGNTGSIFSSINLKGFSKGQLSQHYRKHGREFGNISQREYLNKAKGFAAETNSTFQEAQIGNFVVKYDPTTRRTLVANLKDREIRTFYIADGRDIDPFQAAIDLAKQLSGIK